jgi:hypothetical protein
MSGRDQASNPRESSSEEYDEYSDPMAPPKEPVECWCLHCNRVFMSDQMWFQRVINDPQGFNGFWMCPTNNCDGAGFCFDIFPTDPDHPANAGWHDSEDDEGAEFDEDETDAGEWDPSEPEYQSMDDFPGEDDDMEGEEWKFGLAPGESLPESDAMRDARLRWEDEQKKYDEPDQRPRVVDWSDREDRQHETGVDDIPF